MSEKLTQSEIDALFASVQAGGNVEELKKEKKERIEYEQYDFNRPEKFSLENLKSIEAISTSFAKSATQTISAKLRTPIQVEFSSYDQVPFTTEYADVLNKDEFAFCVTDLGHPDMHEIVIELDLAFAINVHRRNFGGESLKDFNTRRPLTDFEQISLSKFLKTCIYDNLEDAFGSVAEINPSFVKYETDPQMLKVAPNNDMMALITLDLKSKDWSTTLKLCIPFFSIEGVIDRLTSESIREFKPTKKKKSYQKEIEKGLQNVVESVHVSVGEVMMTLDELADLQEGDFIRLDKRLEEPVKGYAAGVHKFDCFIGRDGNKKSFLFKQFKEDEKNK